MSAEPEKVPTLTKNQKRRAKLKEKRNTAPPAAPTDEELAKRSALRKARRVLRKRNEEKNIVLSDDEFERQAEKLSIKYIPMFEKHIKAKKENVSTKTPLETAQAQLSIDELIKKMDTFWRTVLDYAKTHDKFKDMPDKEKLEIFRNAYGYSELMNEYPIITRYIVCMGQYKPNAFRKMLEKIRTAKHPPPEKREKGYLEDQWIRRQADYVQYMWEEYQGNHYNTAEKKWVWQETYRRLKGEFDDFRNMHKEIEKKVAEEKKVLAGKNVRDLLERLKTGLQQIKPEDEQFLRDKLETEIFIAKYKENIKPVLTQLKKAKEEVPPSSVGEGHADENARPQQKIRMIETVDVTRMNEIDDRYKPPELRGMEPVLEVPVNPEEVAEGEEVIEEVEIIE